MEIIFFGLPLIIFVLILFLKERKNMISYIKKVGALFIIGMGCSFFTLFHFALFGIGAVFLTASVVGTLMDFKQKD